MKRAKIKMPGTVHEAESNKTRLEVQRDWAILTETVKVMYTTVQEALQRLVLVHDEMKSINVNIFPIKPGTKIRWERDVGQVRAQLETLLVAQEGSHEREAETGGDPGGVRGEVPPGNEGAASQG